MKPTKRAHGEKGGRDGRAAAAGERSETREEEARRRGAEVEDVVEASVRKTVLVPSRFNCNIE